MAIQHLADRMRDAQVDRMRHDVEAERWRGLNHLGHNGERPSITRAQVTTTNNQLAVIIQSTLPR